ncbi:MAG: hypothetical protein GX303_08125 [Clostridiales bacterium]|nr:hypothetical protein [Clostridiales bacterium]
MQGIFHEKTVQRTVFLLIACCMLPILLYLSPFALTENDADESAEELTASAQMTLSSTQKLSDITDNKISTKITISEPTELAIFSDKGVAGVYLIWDQPPGKWQILAGDRTIECGLYDFVHEYIEIGDEYRSITLHLPEGAVLCDIRLFGKGILPDDIQVWQPPYEKADMLLLPTHADDEHLFFGGTMPYYGGELGYRVQVVYLTNHSLPSSLYWHDTRRIHELLNGLWTVGIVAYPVISDFPDLQSLASDYRNPQELAKALAQAKNQYNFDEWVEFQVENIRRFKPYVILGHDVNGEYGHGAHMLNTESLMKALTISADPEQYPESAEKYGVWDVPKTYLHLWHENTVSMNWDIPLENFGGKTAFQMAEVGYKCHISQHIYNLAVGRSGVSDCRAFGLYRSTVGADVTGGDFFENIDFSEYETEPVTDEVTTSSPDDTNEMPSSTTSKESRNTTKTVIVTDRIFDAEIMIAYIFAIVFVLALVGIAIYAILIRR